MYSHEGNFMIGMLGGMRLTLSGLSFKIKNMEKEEIIKTIEILAQKIIYHGAGIKQCLIDLEKLESNDSGLCDECIKKVKCGVI